MVATTILETSAVAFARLIITVEVLTILVAALVVTRVLPVVLVRLKVVSVLTPVILPIILAPIILATVAAPVILAIAVEPLTIVAILEAIATVVRPLVAVIAVLLAPFVVVPFERLRLLARISVITIAGTLAVFATPMIAALIAVRRAVAAWHDVLIALVLILEGMPGIALRGLRPVRLLGAGDDAEIMLAVLEVVFRRDRIAARQSIARELGIFVGDVLGGSAKLYIGTVRFVGARQRVGTLRPIAATHPSILVWSHRSRLTLTRVEKPS